MILHQNYTADQYMREDIPLSWSHKRVASSVRSYLLMENDMRPDKG